MSQNPPLKRKSSVVDISSSCISPFPWEKRRKTIESGLSVQKPSSTFSSQLSNQSKKTKGVERIPSKYIPKDCLENSPASARNFKSFILRQKRRLLAEGKLVQNGDHQLGTDGLILRWERIESNSAPGTVSQGHSSAFKALRISPKTSEDRNKGHSGSRPANSSNKPKTQEGLSEHDAILISDDEILVDAVKAPSGSPSRGSPKPISIPSGEDEDEDPTSGSESGSSDPRKSTAPSPTNFSPSPGFIPDPSPKLLGYPKETRHVTVPKAPHSRARRIFVQEEYLVTVSMRGDLHFIQRHKRERDKTLSKPYDPKAMGHQHVEDVCSIDGVGVVGFNAGKSQISLIEGTQRIELKALPHLRRGTRDGISCLAPVGRANQEINFISGGYDRTVRLWKVEERTHGTAVETIRVEHPSLIHTLAYNRKKNYIFSASNCDTRLWDLGKNQQMGKGKASNPIYQFHCIPEEPNLLVAEIKHLDRQVVIFDVRKGFMEKGPVVEFGYRVPYDRASKVGVRYQRGDIRGTYFVRGYENGAVILFDFRKPRSTARMELTRRESGATHSIFLNMSTVVAFGEGTVSFLDYTLQ